MSAAFRETLFRRWVWRLPAHSGAVALTFDDGPDAATTPGLLSELARLEVASTHFLVGSKAAAAPGLVQDLRAAGHTIANHAFQHESFLLRPERYQRESIRAADDAIAKAGGGRCSLFRPCFGQINRGTSRALERLGYVGVLWSVIARDWVEQSDEELWQRLRSRLGEGSIIVLHDGHPTTARVIRLLPRLAEEVRSRGLRFISLSPSALLTSGNDA